VAFSNCDALTSAIMPKVTKMGTYAFYWCRALTSVDMPEVTEIDQSECQSCCHGSVSPDIVWCVAQWRSVIVTHSRRQSCPRSLRSATMRSISVAHSRRCKRTIVTSVICLKGACLQMDFRAWHSPTMTKYRRPHLRPEQGRGHWFAPHSRI